VTLREAPSAADAAASADGGAPGDGAEGGGAARRGRRKRGDRGGGDAPRPAGDTAAAAAGEAETAARS
jgi:hypothetical protein